MNSRPLTIWCNAHFSDDVLSALRAGIGSNRLVVPAALQTSNLVGAKADPLLEQADIAFGQPEVEQIMCLPKLKWIHLTSAGYTRYDRPDLRAALGSRGAVLTNSSAVYAEPCAQHILAMMLALARRLPQCLDDQRGPHSWNAAAHRASCRLLKGQQVLVLGYGAIGRRLAELLQPFQLRITAIRRNPSTQGGPITETSVERVDELLSLADHVVNILPANADSEGFLSADRIRKMKPAAILYNIGRGSTVDQQALQEALQQGRIAAAYLDVTDPEPLPPKHPLWSVPNCYITPHTAGGHDDEFERLVSHFLDNLSRFESGSQLTDRVI